MNNGTRTILKLMIFNDHRELKMIFKFCIICYRQSVMVEEAVLTSSSFVAVNISMAVYMSLYRRPLFNLSTNQISAF